VRTGTHWAHRERQAGVRQFIKKERPLRYAQGGERAKGIPRGRTMKGGGIARNGVIIRSSGTEEGERGRATEGGTSKT